MYYAHIGIKSSNTGSPCLIAVLTMFIFGVFQGVQDVLVDPFAGISVDDFNHGLVRIPVEVLFFKGIPYCLRYS